MSGCPVFGSRCAVSVDPSVSPPLTPCSALRERVGEGFALPPAETKRGRRGDPESRASLQFPKASGRCGTSTRGAAGFEAPAGGTCEASSGAAPTSPAARRTSEASNRTVKRGFPVFTDSTLGLPLVDRGETWPLGGWRVGRPLQLSCCRADPRQRGGTPGLGATDGGRRNQQSPPSMRFHGGPGVRAAFCHRRGGRCHGL